MDIYLVGGAVRDQLLGRSVTERDWVVVGATPQEMIALGYRAVGKDFPVFLHPTTHEEYVLARTERSTGPGYADFAFYASPDVTLEQDLERRDLTINAMAQTPEGDIIDPFGGQRDLHDHILRHVSLAFIEDPVRILRVGRFAARLDFQVAEETQELMRSMVREGQVDALVAERVWQEMQGALTEAHPEKFFELLRSCGALQLLFPEIDRLFGIPNPPEWHPEIDSGIHTLMALQAAAQLTGDPVTRFAALMHDLGKAETPIHEWPSHHGHEKKGEVLIKQFCKRYKIPRDYQELAILAAQYHTHCHTVFELTPATILKTLEALDAFRRPGRFEKFLLTCEADARSRTGFEDKPYPQRDFFYAVYKVANEVPLQPFMDRGFEGQKLGEKLHQARVAAIKKFIKYK